MVAMGYAEVYRGAPCQAYCRELEQTEANARQDRVGMWVQGASYESPAALGARLPMLDLSQVVAHWGYAAIFFAVLLGNLGLPVPDEAVLGLAGYLIWAGDLRLPMVLAIGILSAVVGDNIGYWIGRRYGAPVVERYARWVLRKPERVAAARGFIARYGPLAVFAARFLVGVRFLGGPLAGAFGLRILPFAVANLLGAAVFVPFAVGIGYAVGYGLGDHLERIRHVTGQVGIILLAGAAIVMVFLLVEGALRILMTRRSR
jgi:membrane protein DedA with SNARE-associated domain